MSDQHDPAQHDGDEGAPASAPGLSRRNLIAGGAGAAGIGVAAALGGGYAWGHSGAPSAASVMAEMGGDAVDLSVSYPFYTGFHQAGVETPPQRHCVYMTFDIVPGTTQQELKVLFAQWSAGIAQMMAGLPIGSVQPSQGDTPPVDTGEAYGLAPSSLTVTLGLGPGVFDERFGLAAKRPKLLADLPQLPSDALVPATTGGDLSLQACADDPQVAYHAIRDLARVGRELGAVSTRWTVMGFGRASAGQGQQTPRNLMGFKDGTRNIKEPSEFEQFVWLKDDQPWMNGGTYQVARKIKQHIEIWDADRVSDQEHVFGRAKAVGNPLTGTHEFDTPKFHEMRDGQPVISPQAHIALAAHENNGGIKILRRSFNYTDGIDQEIGQLDAGLLFIAYMNDPAHFVQLQTKLGSSDLLNEYITHIGSAIFAVPPAPRQGHYLAEELFA